ncbi:hypothetical protein ACFW5X_34640 [Streptomyces albogriseolus]|uniref:hypothetical protein n=1 Tax=Streptomyces albogriseolus TaxID=1887 RepID=UPI0036ABAA7A
MLATAGLAVVTTLLGAIVSGRFQERAAERQVRAHGEAIRRDHLEAATALACATSDHRTAIRMRGDAILKGAGTDQMEALPSRSHTTRSAGTRPLVALRVLIADQTVPAPTGRMITLTYAIRDAHTTTENLTAALETAKTAHNDFINAAARYLRQTSSRPTFEQESPRGPVACAAAATPRHPHNRGPGRHRPIPRDARCRATRPGRTATHRTSPYRSGPLWNAPIPDPATTTPLT